MAVLNRDARTGCMRSLAWALLALAQSALLASFAARAAPAPPGEYQVKAAFLYNFAQFVEWPAAAFADARAPLVIGVLGEDPFGRALDATVQGETVGNRPLVVRRYRDVEEIDTCHILFISGSETPRLERILRELAGRSILTVGDSEDFARHGGMIRLFTERNRIRMRISVSAAEVGRLTISSKLLRLAETVPAGGS